MRAFSSGPWIPGTLKLDSILPLFKCAYQGCLECGLEGGLVHAGKGSPGISRLELGSGDGSLLAFPVGVDRPVEAQNGFVQTTIEMQGEFVFARTHGFLQHHHPELEGKSMVDYSMKFWRYFAELKLTFGEKISQPHLIRFIFKGRCDFHTLASFAVHQYRLGDGQVLSVDNKVVPFVTLVFNFDRHSACNKFTTMISKVICQCLHGIANDAISTSNEDTLPKERSYYL